MAFSPRSVRLCLASLAVLSAIFARSYSLTLTDVSNLYSTIFTNYDRRFLPAFDQSHPVSVNVSYDIFNIGGFDEISGIITLKSRLTLTWIEERISWNPEDYGGKTSVAVSLEDIWHPQLFLYESADQVSETTNVSVMPRIYSGGIVYWVMPVRTSSICSVDVRYFPFDTQKCILTFGPSSYLQSELILISADTDPFKTTFEGSSQWMLLETSRTETSPLGYVVTLNLQRLSQFYVVYTIIPTMVLSVLNAFVFVMPNESGERLSVATTMILSFVVYMDIVNENIPESSEPMSIFYFYLLFLVVYSAAIMFLCVVSLRVYRKTSEVPPHVQKCVRLLNCLQCAQSETKIYPKSQDQVEKDDSQKVIVTDVDRDRIDSETEDFKEHTFATTDNERDEYNQKTDDVSWDAVGRAFDIVCFLVIGTSNLVATTLIFIEIVH